jgi:Glycosyltransferase family 87
MGTVRRPAGGRGLTTLTAPARTRLFWLLAAVYVVVASAWIAWDATSAGDYLTDAGPPIDALVHGRVHDFLAARPLMGPLSLVVRAPFAALAYLGDHSGLQRLYNDQYRLGVFPCVVAAGIVGIALARMMEQRGTGGRLAQAAVVAVCVVNPVSLRAVHFEHPEEVLGAALLTGAALAGIQRRPWLAAVLLGCALANKQWAVIGAPAVVLIVVLANDRERLRGPALALLGVGLALLVPLLLVDAGSLWDVTQRLGDIRHSPVWPASIWYRLTPPLSGAELQQWAHNLHHMPDWLGLVARPLIIALGIALPLVFAKRVAADIAARGLALLALVMLVRCLFDPANNGYYHVPFLMALIAADAMRGRFWATAVACVLLQAPTTWQPNADDLALFYSVWAPAFAIYLGGRAYGLDWMALVRRRTEALRGRRPAEATPSQPRS